MWVQILAGYQSVACECHLSRLLHAGSPNSQVFRGWGDGPVSTLFAGKHEDLSPQHTCRKLSKQQAPIITAQEGDENGRTPGVCRLASQSNATSEATGRDDLKNKVRRVGDGSAVKARLTTKYQVEDN